jgi:peptidoglycan hydrolase-like protein with peptidoglycan-binding domain
MNQGPTLQFGSTGNDVKRLQRILVMIKLLDFKEIDGIFGSKTKQAIQSIQEGLTTVDGIVGDQTWWVPAGAAGRTLASLAGLTTV